MKNLSLLLPLLLASCSIGPTIRITPEGSQIVTLGASLMEDTSTESAQVSGNGWTLAYQKTGKNQSRAPISIARTAAMYGAASLAAKTEQAREVTTRRGMREVTRRHSTDASVEKTRIATDAAVERAKLEHLGH